MCIIYEIRDNSRETFWGRGWKMRIHNFRMFLMWLYSTFEITDSIIFGGCWNPTFSCVRLSINYWVFFIIIIETLNKKVEYSISKL